MAFQLQQPSHLQRSLFSEFEIQWHPPCMNEYLEAVRQDWHPARPTPVFATYWYFAAARQNVYLQRLQGSSAPWTEDRILNGHRFTNVYRASDRVSQYLIKEVQYPDSIDLSESDIVFRTLLFKIFNRISTWEVLEQEVGPITWRDYNFTRYDKVLTDAMQRNERLFSAAYIMPSGSADLRDSRKHRSYLRLLERMMAEDFPDRLVGAASLSDVFNMVRDYPMMGAFLAFQYAIDLNYSRLIDFREDSFVVAGPGARDGIRKCFADTGGMSAEEIIEGMASRQQAEFNRLGLKFTTLRGRPLQLIDCQNIFCEVDKYARLAHPEYNGSSGRTRIKQSYRASGKACLPSPWFPPKWGINGGTEAQTI